MPSDALKIAFQVVHEVRAMVAIGSSNMIISGITPDLTYPNERITSYARTGGWSYALLNNHTREGKKLIWTPSIVTYEDRVTHEEKSVKIWQTNVSKDFDYDFTNVEKGHSENEIAIARLATRACLYRVGNCGEMTDFALIRICYIIKRILEKNTSTENKFSIKVVQDGGDVDHVVVVFTYRGVSVVCDPWLNHAFEVTPEALFIFKRMLEMARRPIDDTKFQQFADSITGKVNQYFISISTYDEATKMIRLFEKLYHSGLEQERMESTSVSFRAMISTFTEKYNSIQLKKTEGDTVQKGGTHLTEQNDYSPLEKAILYGNDTTVAILLRSHADITDYCITLALLGSNAKIVDLLYQFKPDLQVNYIEPRRLLLEHITNNNIPMLIVLMKHNVITTEILVQTNLFHYATALKSRRLIEFLLEHSPLPNNDEKAIEADAKTVEFILRLGAKFDMRCSLARKALAYIIEKDELTKNDLDLLELFLSKGAEITESLFKDNAYKLFKIYQNASMNKSDFPFTFMQITAITSLTKFPMEKILLDAINCSDLETVSLAIREGANVDTKNEQGETLLYSAIKNRKPLLAKFLREHGANIHEKSLNGDSPILLAAKCGSIPMLTILLHFGVTSDLISDEDVDALRKEAQESKESSVKEIIAGAFGLNSKHKPRT